MMNAINISRSVYSKIARNHFPKCILQTFCYESKLNSLRRFSSAVKELEIPTSYGKLAAKVWGSENGKPVLAFHGWLDNCGTFDKLIPLLKNNYYIIAIDAPGHGMSSHKPPGCLYSDIDAILDYKKVIDYLGWEKFNLLGHSLGGAMALLYSCIYPESVEKVVSIDVAKPFSAPLDAFPQIICNATAEAIKIEKKLTKPPPVYTKENAEARLVEGMHNEINLEAAQILLKRGSKPSECGKGVIFTRDLRCRPLEYVNLKSHELIFQYMSALQSEIMLIMATNPNPNYQSASSENKNKAYEFYRKNVKKFVLEHVEGNHFIHLNNPEKVAPLIDNFL